MSIESAHEWAQSLTAADLEDLLRVARGYTARLRIFDKGTEVRVDAERILQTLRERAAPGIPKGAHAKVGKLRKGGHPFPRKEYLIELTCIRYLKDAGLLQHSAEIGRLVVEIPPGIAYGSHRGEDAPSTPETSTP